MTRPAKLWRVQQYLISQRRLPPQENGIGSVVGVEVTRLKQRLVESAIDALSITGWILVSAVVFNAKGAGDKR